METEGPKGFTLIELLVVIMTIGLLALWAVPSLRVAAAESEATRTADDIRDFTEAVAAYQRSAGSFPQNLTSSRIPRAIATRISPLWASRGYSWFYVNSGGLVYIYIYNLNFTAEQAVRLDRIMDDGNLATGHLRVAYNGSGLVYLFADTTF